MTTGATGYAHPSYAAAVAGDGHPRLLPRSGGSLIVREIGSSGERDAVAAYPMFSCVDWSELAVDLSELSDELVSVAVVVDPFGDWTLPRLETCFPDVLIRFKDHYVVQLGSDPLQHVHPKHRRSIAKGRRAVAVDVVTDLATFGQEWPGLYDHLVERRDVRGAAAFSDASLIAQLSVPGLVALRASAAGVIVGASLWYAHGDVAYYHLAACTPAGYELSASFVLIARAIELFSERGLSWVSLGGGPGAVGDPTDGLSRFKRRWSTDTRPAWFAGRILRPDVYRRLGGSPDSQWFPRYREGEAG